MSAPQDEGSWEPSGKKIKLAVTNVGEPVVRLKERNCDNQQQASLDQVLFNSEQRVSVPEQRVSAPEQLVSAPEQRVSAPEQLAHCTEQLISTAGQEISGPAGLISAPKLPTSVQETSFADFPLGATESAAGPFAVQVLGRQVLFRRLGPEVHFQTASLLELCRRQLPLHSHVTSRQLLLATRQQQQQQELPALGKAFVSWSALKQLLSGWLAELALTDLLASYRYSLVCLLHCVGPGSVVEP
jgi:hypothetical protein